MRLRLCSGGGARQQQNMASRSCILGAGTLTRKLTLQAGFRCLTYLLICAEGIKAEAAYAKDKTLPDPDSTNNPEFKIVLGLIKAGLPKSPQKWTKVGKALRGAPQTLD